VKTQILPAMKLCVVTLIGLAAWVLASGPAQAPYYDHCLPDGSCNWTDLRPADLPVSLRAIEFPGGFILDADNPMCWDNRCVSFGSKRIVADIRRCDARICPNIWVQNLVCEDPAHGTGKCSLQAVRVIRTGYSPPYEHVCYFIAETGTNFRINCPRYFHLE
jgi:hypothetical protein